MRVLLVPLVLSLLLLVSCSNATKSATSPAASSFLTSSDGKQLSLQHWNLRKQPKRVLIALHGLEGAARDYKNLGKALSQQSPDTTLYALNLRSAGYDPSTKERGDIRSAALWESDLLELQETLRERHPKALFYWIGESMGSQIVLHTAADSPVKPDGLVLVSPVVSLDVVPRWQVRSLRVARLLAPRARVSLETLAGGEVDGTTDSSHFEQSESNPYHVESYTLRYLATIAKLAETMKAKASQTDLPVLILHGGKDFLADETEIVQFAAAFPRPAQVALFPKSHHLLFYDHDRKEVISDILSWIAQTP